MNPARPDKESTSPQMTQIYTDLRRPRGSRELKAVRSPSDASTSPCHFGGPGDHLRNSAKSADQFPLISPRKIEVHIEELILHGFDPGARWQIGDALAHELRGLLVERGIPEAWLPGPERIDTGAIPAASLTKSKQTGAEIAGAIYRGGAK